MLNIIGYGLIKINPGFWFFDDLYRLGIFSIAIMFLYSIEVS